MSAARWSIVITNLDLYAIHVWYRSSTRRCTITPCAYWLACCCPTILPSAAHSYDVDSERRSSTTSTRIRPCQQSSTPTQGWRKIPTAYPNSCSYACACAYSSHNYDARSSPDGYPRPRGASAITATGHIYCTYGVVIALRCSSPYYPDRRRCQSRWRERTESFTPTRLSAEC